MAELRRDETIAGQADRRLVEDAGDAALNADDGRSRNVRIEERQQPLSGSQELGGTAPVVTNRRVIDSQVLYQGPASGAPYNAAMASTPAGTTTAGADDRRAQDGRTDDRREEDRRTDDRRTAEYVPHTAPSTVADARTDTRNNGGGMIARNTVGTAAPGLNRSSEGVRQADQPQAAELFPAAELDRFRARWDQVQVSFVDDPEQAVKQADELVASVVKRISDQFAEQRSRLEGQWRKQDNAATTEELRRSLRQYRGFFDRLLSL